MKKLLIVIITVTTLIACEQPQRTRVLQTMGDSELGLTDSSSVDQNSNYQETDHEVTDPYYYDQDAQPTGITAVEGFEGCDLNQMYYANALGYVGVCQNSITPSRFGTKFKTQTGTGKCFVPMYEDQSTGQSTKLGTAQCVNPTADKEYEFRVYADESYPGVETLDINMLNSLMVIDYSALQAFEGCMSAKNDYYASTMGCCYDVRTYGGKNYCVSTNPSCDDQADTNAQIVCSLFKNNNYNNYKIIRL